jgi:hypothetical protein
MDSPLRVHLSEGTARFGELLGDLCPSRPRRTLLVPRSAQMQERAIAPSGRQALTQVFLTPPDLAERWHCSVGWLANLRSAGRGPAWLRVGSKVLYSLDAVEAYELHRRVEPLVG